MKEDILKAYSIAARDLRACYNPDGIVAGRTHFNSYWSRDGFWAVFGALELRDFSQAKKHLELFIRHQKPNGQIPTRIEFIGHTLGTYEAIRRQPLPVFRAAHLANPVDPTALFIMAAWQYFRHTRDIAFLRKNFFHFDHAISFLQQLDRDGDGVLETGILSDWMDSVLKWGKILHINIMYYKALEDFAQIGEMLNKHDVAKTFGQLAKFTKTAIRNQFWSGDYFFDWRRGKKSGHFCADGNVLAMLYGIASPEQAKTIIDYINSNKLELQAGIHTIYPRYSWYQILPNYYLYGIPDYHIRMIWPWITSLYALAKWRLGKHEDALKTLSNLSELILHNDFVGEVYEPSGAPVKRLIYRSEVPFAWNAAAFIYAVKSMGLAGRHEVMVK